MMDASDESSFQQPLTKSQEATQTPQPLMFISNNMDTTSTDQQQVNEGANKVPTKSCWGQKNARQK